MTGDKFQVRDTGGVKVVSLFEVRVGVLLVEGNDHALRRLNLESPNRLLLRSHSSLKILEGLSPIIVSIWKNLFSIRITYGSFFVLDTQGPVVGLGTSHPSGKSGERCLKSPSI